jgi:NADH:ubiquinone oxidoreductase subunit 6 (subunit J)
VNCYSRNNTHPVHPFHHEVALRFEYNMQREIIFCILAGVAVVSAALMVSRTRAINSAFFLVLMLLAGSGLFLELRAPLVFAAQFVIIAAALIGIIFVGVEVSKLDVALAAEYFWRSKAAAIAAASGLLVELALTFLERRLLPGERLTVLLPKANFPWPLSAKEVLRFFFTYDLLPLGVMLFLLLIAIVGIGAVFQRRA